MKYRLIQISEPMSLEDAVKLTGTIEIMMLGHKRFPWVAHVQMEVEKSAEDLVYKLENAMLSLQDYMVEAGLVRNRERE